MNYLDLIISIPLLWGLYKGWQRGLIFEVAMLIGLILGFYIAFKCSSLFESLLSKFVDAPQKFIPWITFIIVFVAVLVLFILLAKFLESLLKAAKLTAINQVAGAALGCLKLALTVSVILSLLRPIDAKLELISANAKSTSILYQPVLQIAHFIFPAMQDMKEEFSKRVN